MRAFERSSVGLALACWFLCGWGTALFADGIYLPASAVKKLPEIPIQRALLSWKDGTETLVISSALDSQAQKLGWLIPLPSVPREMTKMDPGVLKTLAFCVQPRITHDLTRPVRVLTVVIGWLAVAIVLSTFAKRLLPLFFTITIILLVFGSMLLPGLGSARSTFASTSHVRLEKTAKVGAYDIAVLTVRGTTELNRWLTENEFTPLPATAEPIVADYVRSGWKFVAIKLTRAESGSSTPHPIKLVFSSREAVYPWKLTTLAGGQPLLELFVVGPSRAAVGKLRTEFCQRLLGSKEFKADQARMVISHPEIAPLLWDGCILTKLSGHLDARRQRDDLPVRWVSFKPYQQHFYSTDGARDVAWIVFISVLGIICLPGWILCTSPNGERFEMEFYFGTLAPRTLLAATLIAGTTYACLPKLGASEIQVFRFGSVMRHVFPLLQVRLEYILQREPAILQQDEPAIAETILQRLSITMPAGGTNSQRRLTNQFLGGEVQAEASPGNFTIEKQAGKVVVRVYDQIGSPLLSEYPVLP